MAVSWITNTTEGVLIDTHICPRAARDQIQGLHGDAVKIRLRAPPVDGKANAALIDFISLKLGVPKNQCAIVAGQSSRRKRIAVAGISANLTRTRLGLPQTDSSSGRQSS